MINLKAWHVLKDAKTGRRACYYYDKNEQTIDLGEPDSMEGKEEIPIEEWSAKEIGDILSSAFEYRGNGELLVCLPEITLHAMNDCGLDDSKKDKIMREIMNAMMSQNLD